MKFLCILKHYMKGIRFPVLILAVMLTWAMLSGVIAIAKLQNIRSDVRAFYGADAENLYVLNSFSNPSALSIGENEDLTQKMEAALEDQEAVEQVYTVRVVNPVLYNGISISIVLYEPGMLNAIPGLKKLGIDFGKQADGCILGSKVFAGIETGDVIQLSFSNQAMDSEKLSFPVAGQLKSPYRRLSLSLSATTLYAEDLFETGDTILMQSTDAVMEQLESVAKRIDYDKNLIVQFKPGVSETEKSRILTEIAPDYLYHSLEDVIGVSKAQISRTLKQELPLPIFLAIVALVAYLSLVILSIKKKERDLAVLALCGCSTRKCLMISLCSFQNFLVLPIIINSAFVIFWQKIQWVEVFSKIVADNPAIMHDQESLTKLHTIISVLDSNITVDNSGFVIIILYYLITCAIAFFAVAGAAKRKSPRDQLRGVLQ